MTNKSSLTKKDISLLLETFKSVFATKKDLKQFATRAELEEFRQGVYERFEGLEGQIKGLPAKDEFYKMMDKIMSELKTIREEQIIIGHRVAEDREQIVALEEIHPAGQHKTL